MQDNIHEPEPAVASSAGILNSRRMYPSLSPPSHDNVSVPIKSAASKVHRVNGSFLCSIPDNIVFRLIWILIAFLFSEVDSSSTRELLLLLCSGICGRKCLNWWQGMSDMKALWLKTRAHCHIYIEVSSDMLKMLHMQPATHSSWSTMFIWGNLLFDACKVSGMVLIYEIFEHVSLNLINSYQLLPRRSPQLWRPHCPDHLHLLLPLFNMTAMCEFL